MGGRWPGPRKLAHENPDFIFCGIQRGEALARHFASGDLFLFPSRSETFGNVTLESMASGVATVAFDYGAAREYLRNGENGAAVDNDEQFIEAAVQLAADDAQRHVLGNNAARAMKRLHPQQVVAEFDALLAELAQSRRTGHAHNAANCWPTARHACAGGPTTTADVAACAACSRSSAGSVMVCSGMC